jgi:hypothetical protein
MSAVPAPERQSAGWHAGAEWAEIAAAPEAAPRCAAICGSWARS